MKKLIYRAYCSRSEKISWSSRPRQAVSCWCIGTIEDDEIKTLSAYSPPGEGGKVISEMTDEEKKIVRLLLEHPEAESGEISYRLGRHTLLTSETGHIVAEIPDEGVTLRWY